MVRYGHDAAELRDQVPPQTSSRRTATRRNPVASRNNVVAKLLAATNEKMDKEVKLQGAKDLAAAFHRPPDLRALLFLSEYLTLSIAAARMNRPI